LAFCDATKNNYPEWLESGSSYNINGTGSNKDYYSSRGMSRSNVKNPITGVSWYNAVAYCNWLSEQEGKQKYYSISGTNVTINSGANGYRLPTEAEWEYAAKGGNQSKGYKYAGSNTVDEVAEYSGNNNKTTKPVGGKKANELGICDMSGNVWEWCYDWYGTYSTDNQINPTGATSGSNRVFRGGSWYGGATFCRVSVRNDDSPDIRSNDIGFRLCRDL